MVACFHIKRLTAATTKNRRNPSSTIVLVIVAVTMFLAMISTIHRYSTPNGSRRFIESNFVAAYIGPVSYRRWNTRRLASQSTQQRQQLSTRQFSTTQEETEESISTPDVSTTDTTVATTAVTPIDFQFDMDDVISLCKRRGLIFPSSEIYNGYAGFYDYGPIGVELKRSVKDFWWKTFVTSREDVVGLDSSIIHNPTTWKSSGMSLYHLNYSFHYRSS